MNFIQNIIGPYLQFTRFLCVILTKWCTIIKHSDHVNSVTPKGPNIKKNRNKLLSITKHDSKQLYMYWEKQMELNKLNCIKTWEFKIKFVCGHSKWNEIFHGAEIKQ